MAEKTTYKVVAGDTLWSIAERFNTTVDAIAELNDIQNKNLIHVGQELVIFGEKQKNASYSTMVTVTSFGLQADTTRTMFVRWAWDKEDKISYYIIEWWVQRSDKEWFSATRGSNTCNPDIKENIFTADEKDIAVKVSIKPIPLKEEKNGTEVNVINTAWTAYKEYSFNLNPPEKLSTPEIYIEGNKLTLELNNIESNATHVEYRIIQNDSETSYKTNQIAIITNKAKWTVDVEPDARYRAQCRGVTQTEYGEWSDYTAEVSSLPKMPTINSISVLDKTTISYTWTRVDGATKYKVQWVAITDSNQSIVDPDNLENLFEATGADVKSDDLEVKTDNKDPITRYIQNVAPGTTYYMRMCSVPSSSNSISEANLEWCYPIPFVIGTKSTSPTTWSSSTTAVVGDLLKFYWIHNSEDSSISSGAHFYMNYGSGDVSSENLGLRAIITFSKENGYRWYSGDDASPVMTAYKVQPDKTDDHTYVLEIDTSATGLNGFRFQNGATIYWKVATAGAVPDEYGDHSAVKKVEVYTKPSINLDVRNYEGTPLPEDTTPTVGQYPRILTSLPFTVHAAVNTTSNQKPTGYHINIIANQSYNTVDNFGNEKFITGGSSIYSKYIDKATFEIDELISAGDVSLENNIEYTLTCMVAMDSGLKTEATSVIRVAWEGDEYSPAAQIGINQDDLSAMIRPYIEGNIDAELDVYRREYDGSFTKINSSPITTDENGQYIEWITDPHPSLDYARYRITARSKQTGRISYTDMPLVTVGEKGVVIQWDEAWSNFYVEDGYVLEKPTWAGSMLKLRYNIGISTNGSKDAALVGYIGRKHPVSYYGTQIGESQSWNVEIPKDDKETLYGIRRLNAWMGDVYVREPSGIGYWAHVTVSYNQSYSSLTIPISFNITRVEGGI